MACRHPRKAKKCLCVCFVFDNFSLERHLYFEQNVPKTLHIYRKLLHNARPRTARVCVHVQMCVRVFVLRLSTCVWRWRSRNQKSELCTAWVCLNAEFVCHLERINESVKRCAVCSVVRQHTLWRPRRVLFRWRAWQRTITHACIPLHSLSLSFAFIHTVPADFLPADGENG